MADLSLAERFGKGATLDLEYRQLIINLDDLGDFDPNTQQGDFTNGLGLDTSGITEANKGEYVSKILWALIQLSKQNQPENNTDNEVGIYITNGGRRNQTRNGVAQIGFQETVAGYKDDPTGLNLDPDDIGSEAVSS